MSDAYGIRWMEAGPDSHGAAEMGGEFSYYAPTTPEEAERLKSEIKGAHYLGGGTILNWRGSPRITALIDLKHLGLNTITISDTDIALGATTTIQAIAEHPDLPIALKQAAGLFTSRNVRNMATIGGTATGLFFVSDVLPVLGAFQAEIEYMQHGETHRLPIANWLRQKAGLICAIHLKPATRIIKFRQEKISGLDFPLIVTAIGCNSLNATINSPVVAISGATNHICFPTDGAAYLSGKTFAELDGTALNEAVQQEIEPTGSVKASARVKRRIIESHLKALIEELQQEVAA